MHQRTFFLSSMSHHSILRSQEIVSFVSSPHLQLQLVSFSDFADLGFLVVHDVALAVSNVHVALDLARVVLFQLVVEVVVKVVDFVDVVVVKVVDFVDVVVVYVVDFDVHVVDLSDVAVRVLVVAVVELVVGFGDVKLVVMLSNPLVWVQHLHHYPSSKNHQP